MRSSIFYRIAAVLLVLFAAGHTLGFREVDPAWGVGAVVASMKDVQFDMQGFRRTYWDFFEAAGFTVGVLYVFAAVLAWQLGGLPPGQLARLRGAAWAFALSFGAITALSWRFLFVVPVVFAGLITLMLVIAAALIGGGEARADDADGARKSG